MAESQVHRAPAAEGGVLPRRVVGRYAILEDIGRGGQARTYLAEDVDRGARVALKELDLRRAEDWKALELFEREGRVLRGLTHPGIPRYIDAFELEDAAGGLARYFIVQEFVAGESLQARIDRGGLLHEDEARALLDQVLAILEYLHAQSPPVVHRDIKPANIMVRPDGSYALIDFGAVQEVVQRRVGGETVVGTSGFLPPEQLMGRAQPASDVYALGATVVYAMSGVHPVDIAQHHMRLDFADLLDCSRPFIAFLERMLDPLVDRRFDDAQHARLRLQALPNPRALQVVDVDVDALLAAHPHETLEKGKVRVARHLDLLVIDAAGGRGPNFLALLVFLGAIVGFPIVFINPVNAAILGSVFLGITIALTLTHGLGRFRHTIEFRPDAFTLTRRWLGMTFVRRVPLARVRKIEDVDGAISRQVALVEGFRTHTLVDQISAESSGRLRRLINDYIDEFDP